MGLYIEVQMMSNNVILLKNKKIKIQECRNLTDLHYRKIKLRGN